MVHGKRECFSSPQIIKTLRQIKESSVWVNAEGYNEKESKKRKSGFRWRFMIESRKRRCDHEQDRISGLDRIGLVDMLN